MTPKKSYFSIEEKEKEVDDTTSSKNNHIKALEFHLNQAVLHLNYLKEEQEENEKQK